VVEHVKNADTNRIGAGLEGEHEQDLAGFRRCFGLVSDKSPNTNFALRRSS